MALDKNNTVELRNLLDAHKLLKDYFAFYPDIDKSKIKDRDKCLKLISEEVDKIVKKIAA